MTDDLAARRRQKLADTGPSLAAIQQSFILSLRDRNVSDRTVEVYARTFRQFLAWPGGAPDTVGQITPEQLREFIGAETRRTSAVSADQHYRNLNVIFKWLVTEGELDVSPMVRVQRPKVTEKVKGIIAEDDLGKLLKVCEGNDFESRRDAAILSVLIDTGTRVSGLAGMRVADVSLGRGEILIVLKGGDEWLVPLGRKTVAAVDRYLRARARHKHAGSPWLWLGLGGHNVDHFGPSGIQAMVDRRARQAGIEERITPHAFRRTVAHDLLAAGANEYDVMNVVGWKTPEMVRRYSGALAAERARATHKRISPRDRLQ